MLLLHISFCIDHLSAVIWQYKILGLYYMKVPCTYVYFVVDTIHDAVI